VVAGVIVDTSALLAYFDASETDHSAVAEAKEIGVADASNVVLAERYRTRTIMTLDRRHFDVLRPVTGGRLTVLPAVV
jgi:uncharacterized protein